MTMNVKYNRLMKIINFKELVIGSGAFFDKVTVSARFSQIDVKVC